MAYTHTTLATARAALATRLQDPNNIYWSAPELTLYLQESIRTRQSLTGYYRDRVGFDTTANQRVYDLSQIPALDVPFGYHATDTDAITRIQYALLEKVALPWAGTDQFSTAQLLQALQRRRDQFLLDTGCALAVQIPLAIPAPTSRIPLLDSIIDIRRSSFTDSGSGLTYSLSRQSDFSQSHFGDWSPSDPPSGYSISSTPPVSLQFHPPSQSGGNLSLITVSSGPTLTGLGALIGIPDDFVWGVMFGALADLLSADGQARDPFRASYCESRYRESVAAASVNPSILQAWVADAVVPSGSIFELDSFYTNWENESVDPDFIGMAGRNVLALPIKADTVYSIDLDAMPNAVVPAVDGDFLQVGREHLESVLDYAQHLASFKLAGEEFRATIPLYQNFLRLCQLENARIESIDPFRAQSVSPSLKPAINVPRNTELPTG